MIDLGGLRRDTAAARASFQGLSLVVHLWPANRAVRHDSIPFKIRCQMMSSPCIMHHSVGDAMSWCCYGWKGILRSPVMAEEACLHSEKQPFALRTEGWQTFVLQLLIAYAFRVLKS